MTENSSTTARSHGLTYRMKTILGIRQLSTLLGWLDWDLRPVCIAVANFSPSITPSPAPLLSSYPLPTDRMHQGGICLLQRGQPRVMCLHTMQVNNRKGRTARPYWSLNMLHYCYRQRGFEQCYSDLRVTQMKRGPIGICWRLPTLPTICSLCHKPT